MTVRALASVIAAGLLGACSGEPSSPTGATLEIILTTPAQDDGAVLFTVTGGPIDSVEAAGHALYSSRPDPNTLQVIVTGDLRGGTIARIHISDEHRSAQYSATIHQVAARTTYAQRDPGAYALTLTP
jgi:hydroxyethylthiazole kinase-like sugar kinase family protein